MKIKRIVATMLAFVMLLTTVVVYPAPQVMAADKNQAKTAYDAFLKEYLYQENGMYKLRKCGTTWSAAETIEVIIDGYELFGDEKYKEIVCGLIEWYVSNNGEYWEDNGFNDDVMWAVIMCTRAYMLTGTERYLSYAIDNFEMCYNRAWSEDLGGGLWWRIENNTKNACVNGPGAIAACLLGEATGKESYFTKAKAIMDWEIDVLLTSDCGVKDSYNIEKKYNNWVATYNQGTFIGAVTMLYLHYGEQKYLDYAKKASDYTTKKLTESLKGEDHMNDAVGFKGILARWLGYFIIKCDIDDYNNWFNEQGNYVWKNRNSKNLMWTRFREKTEENIENSNNDKDSIKKNYAGWGCSSGLSWILNCADLNDRQSQEKQRKEPIGLTAAKMSYENIKKDAENAYRKGSDQYTPSSWNAFEDIYLDPVEVKDTSKLVDWRSAIEPLANGVLGLRARNSAGKTIEMESGDKLGGAKNVDAKDCSGGKYVGSIGGGDNGSVSFILTADASGEHTIYLKYCTQQNRKLRVTVNGQAQTVECKSVGSWNKPGNDAKEIKVTLNRGDNTVVFDGDNGADGPNLDCFEFSRANTNDNRRIEEEEKNTVKNELKALVDESQKLYDLAPTMYTNDSWNAYKAAHDNAKNASGNASVADLTKFKSNLERTIKGLVKNDGTKATGKVKVEAEAGEFVGGAQLGDSTMCSGEKYVGWIGGTKKGSIKHRVTVDTQGKYVIGVTYGTMDRRQLVVKVNGTRYETYCEPTSDWTIPSKVSVSIVVTLNKGQNELEFTADTDGPNMDYFTYSWDKSIQNRLFDTGCVLLAEAVTTYGTVYKAGQKNYTDNSWGTFKTCYERARDASGNSNAELTADDVLLLRENLIKSEEALEEKSSGNEDPKLDSALVAAKEALNKAIASARSTYEEGQKDYTDESWKKFVDSYKEAAKIPAITENSTVTKEQLDSLRTELLNAQNSLTKKDKDAQDVATAKKNLQNELANAQETYEAGQNDYTSESWEVFITEYQSAKSLLKDINATVEELNNCASRLGNAKNNLKKYDESLPDEEKAKAEEAFLKAMEDAKSIYEAGQGNYTTESWKEFKKAYEKARINKVGATTEELKALTETLKKTRENLQVVKSEKPSGVVNPSVIGNSQIALTQEEIKIQTALGVSTETTQKIFQMAKQQNVSVTTVTTTDSYIKGVSNDHSVSSSAFAPLSARAAKQTKNSIKLKWKLYNGADGYLVYGSKSGKPYKLLTTIGSRNKTNYTQKGLKKGTYYKYLICAYKIVDNTKVNVAVSKTVLAATIGGRYGVTKSIKVKSIKGGLKVGKTKKLSAKVKNKSKKKTYSKLAYESDNTKVATVSDKGKIKAVGKGTCNIYIYAQNGVFKQVKVKVK